MWLQVAVCLSCLLLGGQGQERAAFYRSNDRNSRCQYTFTVASPAESSCPTAVGGAEMDSLKSRLTLLESLVSRLVGGDAGAVGAVPDAGLQEAYTQAMGENSQLQRDKERLDRQVQELQRRVEEQRQETERLLARPCQAPSAALQDQRPASGSNILSHLVSGNRGQSETVGARDPAWQHGSPGYQELKAEVTEVPAPKQIQESSQENTGCGELVSIGEPVSHRRAEGIAGKYGVWMQDPEAVAPYGTQMLWRINTVGTEVRELFGYEDMDQLSLGFPTKVLLLPEPVESTGATMYRGSLYYQRRRSRTLLRYDLATESIASRRDLPHAGFHGQFPYSWGGYTDIDLAVDEQGLWAIYSTNKAKGAIVASQLDPNSLEVKKSWETNIRKNTVANAFMICGRLYTVASYSSPNTTVNYMFDTATSESKSVAVPLRNRYRYNSMVDYNRVQRKLFAWDNFHMVSYDVRLGKPEAN
ncbi:myocilin isoform X1 [Conger conger]|uniref:myocilin isoform X1 n=1 Tax=Conger conger TaxID=82655 RepID=UPI002A5B0565|nr:myocilin isoform X1 [Conger conger]